MFTKFYCDILAELLDVCVVSVITAFALPVISVNPVELVLPETVLLPVETLLVTVLLTVVLFVCTIVVEQLLFTLTELFDPAPFPETVILVSPPHEFEFDGVGVGMAVGLGVGVEVGPDVGVTVGVAVGVTVVVGVGVREIKSVGVGDVNTFAVEKVLFVAFA